MRCDQTHTISIQFDRPGADAVFLVGQFNNWSTLATPMRRLPSGIWQADLPAGTSVGRHSFFIFEDAQPFGRMLRGPTPIAPSPPLVRG